MVDIGDRVRASSFFHNVYERDGYFLGIRKDGLGVMVDDYGAYLKLPIKSFSNKVCSSIPEPAKDQKKKSWFLGR